MNLSQLRIPPAQGVKRKQRHGGPSGKKQKGPECRAKTFEIFIIPENIMEAEENGIQLPRRGTERHDALFNLGMAKRVTFERKDFDYCKNHMLMAFADGIPDFVTKMQNFMFYSSSRYGQILVEAPAGRIVPTNFTLDDLTAYNPINLSLLTICSVWEVEIARVDRRKYTSAPDIPILSKRFMIAFSRFRTAIKSRPMMLNPIARTMTTSLF